MIDIVKNKKEEGEKMTYYIEHYNDIIIYHLIMSRVFLKPEIIIIIINTVSLERDLHRNNTELVLEMN